MKMLVFTVEVCFIIRFLLQSIQCQNIVKLLCLTCPEIDLAVCKGEAHIEKQQLSILVRLPSKFLVNFSDHLLSIGKLGGGAY